MSACFEDKYGLYFMNPLRHVTRLGLLYIGNKKRRHFALNDKKKKEEVEEEEV
jgi:hypothetical protein